jgi:hypothetical protein
MSTYMLYVAFIDKFIIQCHGCLNLCCAVNWKFLIKSGISTEGRKHLKLHTSYSYGHVFWWKLWNAYTLSCSLLISFINNMVSKSQWINLMLKRSTYVFILPTLCCCAYADNTGGNACIVYAWYVFFISTRSIKNLEFAKNAHGNCVFWHGLHFSSLVNEGHFFSLHVLL